MHKWQDDFIEGLRQGKSPDNLARSCAGLPLNAVQSMRDQDPEFAMLWDEAYNYAAQTRRMNITPQALEKVLASQLSDKEIAAYFMMTSDELLTLVQSDTTLKAVYDFGRDSAKVKIALAQYDNAISGHADMQKWLGRQHLNQAETGGASGGGSVQITFNMNDPGDSYRRIINGGTITLEDKVKVEVIESDNAG